MIDTHFCKITSMCVVLLWTTYDTRRFGKAINKQTTSQLIVLGVFIRRCLNS